MRNKQTALQKIDTVLNKLEQNQTDRKAAPSHRADVSRAYRATATRLHRTLSKLVAEHVAQELSIQSSAD